MRRFVLLLPAMLAATALTGCETVSYNEGPVEYALRPDYSDVYRQPSVQVYERYDSYGDVYDRPPPPPRYYRPYGGPGPRYDRYAPYERY